MFRSTEGTGPSLPIGVEDDGVAVLSLSNGGRTPDRFGLDLLHHLDTLLDVLEPRFEAGDARVVIVRLGASRPVRTDLDLDEVWQLPDPHAASVWSQEGQRVLQRIERLPVPTVAAISGSCMWGGTQVALACTYRVAESSPATRMGLPEASLGILPGWGGSVRLPRVIGIRAALRLLLERGTVSARRAESIGLVDDVFSPARFEARVRRFALSRSRRGAELPASRRGLATRVLEDTAPGRRLVFARVNRQARRQRAVPSEISDAYVSAIADGVGLPLEAAFAREAETFARVVSAPLARARLLGYRLTTAEPVRGPVCRRAAVVGAGTQGVYLSHLMASHGLRVRIKELRRGDARLGVERVRGLLARQVAEGSLSDADLARHIRRVTATVGFGGFGRVDVVLAAVGEHPGAQAAVLRELEEHVRDGCVLLSTSPLPSISEVQQQMLRPGRLAGLHLFHPAGRRALAEVVRGEHTEPATVVVAAALARRLGKLPVVVSDRPGLVCYRVLVPYLNEALRLQNEGLAPAQVDSAAKHFGFPVGPFRLLSELGRDRVARLARALAHELGERFAPPSPDAPARPPPDGLLRRLLGARHAAVSLPGGAGPPADPQSRLVLAMVNEAARVLDEQVVPSAFLLDRVLTLAIGFPADRGGLLFYADRIGIPAIVEMLGVLAAQVGDRFAPAPLLLRLARDGGGFYSHDVRAAPPEPRRSDAGHPAVEVLR
jgi:3-hydroxyacyl-CoA dehydrogenase/enoyl-CoA hydratase/carnithine racemase